MTLSRQLILTAMTLLLCLFVGMLTYVVRNTEIYLSQQLSSHSQDTATALGVTLTFTMKNNDVIAASRIVDAVWDRGYYSTIEVQSANGDIIVKHHETVKVYNVPQWFINMLHLNTEQKEALIMDGWLKVGKVIVESNPGFAYEQIWNTFIESLKWLLWTSLMAIILGGFLLYIILKPLKAITSQAIAICNQQFPVQEALPWTIDLRQVVEAMNNMSKRLKKLFEEQAEVSERLREQAYQDHVTQLANRRYFDMQLDFLLQDKEHSSEGVLLIIELFEFKEYNEKFGYQEGDRLLINVALAIKEVAEPYENVVITHAKGASFFIILPGKTKIVGDSLAEKLSMQFKEFNFKKLAPMKNIAHIGVSTFKPGELKKDIMSRLDMALRAAQTQGDNAWHSIATQTRAVHAATDWKRIFEKVVTQKQIVLHFQEMSMWTEESDPPKKYYEVLMRIHDEDNHIIPAGVFMPMAEQLNVMQSLDQIAIEMVVNRILEKDDPIVYFVNISPTVIDDEKFSAWIIERLEILEKKAGQLVIELPEQAVVSRVEKVRNFYRHFSSVGGKTSVDHYGKSFSSFSYLYNLKLNYLKIDGGFTRNIDTNEENQFFIRSLIEIAHSLDIYVVAESVETAQECDVLKELNIDAAQGYYVGKPTDL